MEELEHFSHSHPLIFCQEKQDSQNHSCNGCSEIISGPAYNCTACNFNLHKSCASLPFEIFHLFHRQHPLFLSYCPKSWKCSKCHEDSTPGFKYHCYRCSYTLDLKCASLIDISDPKPESTQQSIISISDFLHQDDTLSTHIPLRSIQQIEQSSFSSPDFHHPHPLSATMEVLEHFTHSHPLIFCQEKQGDQDLPCDGCSETISGPAYSCRACNFNLHKSCASLPFEIFHLFHRQHPLFLSYWPKSWKCSKCHEDSNPGFKYYCYRCSYTLDLKCASLIDISDPKPESTQQSITSISDFLHQDDTLGTYIPLRSIQQIEQSSFISPDFHHPHPLSATMEVLEHFTHSHPLIFCQEKQGDQDLPCDGCSETISSPAYSCRACNFNLHKSCASLPFEIFHLFHGQHPLFLSYWPKSWKCNKCHEDSTPGFKYHCYRCSYTLDLKCASITAISHFLHQEHPLILKVLRTSLEGPKVTCFACQLPFSHDSLAYCCVDCVFLLHQSCVKIEQTTENKHLNKHFHPDHHLTALKTSSSVDCAACKTKFKGISYCCNTCNFHLHVNCAKLQLPALKHKRHQEHDLYYFINSNQNKCFTCEVCNFNCEGSFYRCVICDISFHFECIPLPQTVLEYKDHKHGLLTFMDRLAEDGCAELYCNACKELRNPEHSVYYCKDCSYAVDIQCLMAEEGKTLKVESYMVSKHDNAKLEHFSHSHPLFFCQEKQDDQDLPCDGCSEIISGPAYNCRICNFNLHQSCANLPFEIFHRFHWQHPLFLSYWPKSWKCSKCNEDSIPGFKYHCYKCSFTLDLKCASLAHISPFSLESTEINITTKNHFLHQEHQLISADLTTPFVGRNKNTCCACQLPFSGNNSRAYCCIECLFFLHESCLDIKPVMENLSFHSHPLVAQFESWVDCAVCKTKFRGINYCCKHNTCNFYVHLTCASLELPAIRHKRHQEHNLYYFMISSKKQSFPCDVCYFNCNGSFYRCVICDINFHFECIPLPQTVLEYKGHRHGPLTFVDRLVEDGAKEFYCANCEEPRNPERSVYYCEVCPHEADIHCVMAEEGKTLEVGSYMVSKFKHFSSRHSLVLLQGEAEGLLCNGCNGKIISGPAYGCRDCPFYLHKSCVNLPTEISHRFHEQHQLYLSYWAKFWRCYNCNKSSPPGFRYQCHSCFYALDLKCALTNVPPSTLESMTPFSHFLHKEHQLNLKDLSTYQDIWTCSSCQLPFSEDSSLAYGCFVCEFFLHRFCSDIEETIDNKHFHPAHHLTALSTNSYVNCAACKTKFQGVSYCCNTCNFHLHVKCAELQLPALKHKCHQEHCLYYFINSNQKKYFTCDVCYLNCEGSFYRCVICDINFHFECIPLPKTVWDYEHRHGPLTLRDKVGADAGKHCSSCKKLRNPEHSAYYCEDCSRAVDIHCVMAEEGKTFKVESYMVPKFEHFSHQHHLASEETEALGHYCNGCDKIILGPAYGCKDCQFYLHKSCTELPFEISHPFHQQHSLFLSYWPKTWKCNKCGDQSTRGFKYSCYKCDPAITLDLKCAYEVVPAAGQQVVDTSQEIVVDELVKIIRNLRAELRQR